MPVATVLPPRYRGPQRIARGGMGEIYRATDDVLGRAVAIKVLAERYSADDAVGSRFTREALAAARLSGQPNTITIFDVGEWNDRPFIVMEYLPGGSLADRLTREGSQPPERVLPWLEQAADALDSAHRNGVVHRDVKPANLLLDRDGVVHVADFGIASAVGLASLTTTGTVLGTAGYLAPEQARGEATTAASDRYALAVTAFELLTGDRPFAHESPTAEASAHLHAPVPSISAGRRHLPSGLDRVFERALAKDPRDRYSTCGEFASALRDGFYVAAGSTVLMHPPARPRRRSRLPLALALAAAAAAGIALAVVLASGGERAVVRSVTLPGTTVRATVTQATTVQQTVTSAPPTATVPPASPDGHRLNDQGFARMQAGDYEGALPLLQQAVELLRGVGPDDPYEAWANYNLGYTLLQLGRCDEALVYLRASDRLQDRGELDRALRRAQECAGGGGDEG